MTTVFALGYLDDRNRLWFISRAANVGNMMRTTDPASARTLPTVPEIELWVDRLPECAKEQIADRQLLIVPLTITVGNAVGTFMLRTVTPAATDTPAEHEVAHGGGPRPALVAK